MPLTRLRKNDAIHKTHRECAITDKTEKSNVRSKEGTGCKLPRSTDHTQSEGKRSLEDISAETLRDL